MNYVESYATVARYGRAPAKGVASFAEQSTGDRNRDPQNNSDHVFADWLEEHDDPRHLIVRGDLEIRRRPGPHWVGKAHNDASEKLGENAAHAQYGQLRRLEDPELGTLGYSPVTGRNGRRVYETYWSTGDSEYNAHLSPDEHAHLLAGLGLTDEDFNFDD